MQRHIFSLDSNSLFSIVISQLSSLFRLTLYILLHMHPKKKRRVDYMPTHTHKVWLIYHHIRHLNIKKNKRISQSSFEHRWERGTGMMIPGKSTAADIDMIKINWRTSNSLLPSSHLSFSTYMLNSNPPKKNSRDEIVWRKKQFARKKIYPISS